MQRQQLIEAVEKRWSPPYASTWMQEDSNSNLSKNDGRQAQQMNSVGQPDMSLAALKDFQEDPP